MKNLFLLTLILSATTFVAQEKEATTPQIAMKISLGETITMHGITMEFVQVLEDSRCPTDVVCVWAGQAIVSVIFSQTHVTTENNDLIVGKKDKNVIGQDDGFIYKAVALTPYPTNKNMGKRKYALLVVREKL